MKTLAEAHEMYLLNGSTTTCQEMHTTTTLYSAVRYVAQRSGKLHAEQVTWWRDCGLNDKGTKVGDLTVGTMTVWITKQIHIYLPLQNKFLNVTVRNLHSKL